MLENLSSFYMETLGIAMVDSMTEVFWHTVKYQNTILDFKLKYYFILMNEHTTFITAIMKIQSFTD
jgi:hypothetical protein